MKGVIWALIHKQNDGYRHGERQERVDVEKAFADLEGVDADDREFVVRYGCGNVGTYLIYGLGRVRGMVHAFEARWKDELVCACGKGKFVLDFKMEGGGGRLYFPSQEAWEESCRVWAKGDWALVRELLSEWCREKKSGSVGRRVVRGDEVPGQIRGRGEIVDGFLWRFLWGWKKYLILRGLVKGSKRSRGAEDAQFLGDSHWQT